MKTKQITKDKKNKKHPIRTIILILLALSIGASAVFMYFGGFGTGECAPVEELKLYAGTLEDIAIPQQAEVIALGEATHGNAEFHQLKLDVFRILVAQQGVRAFVLEGDYGCCEAVNRYIHGGEGTAQQAAAAIGFPIYRTEQMAELIDWMRSYNETAKDGDDLRFYGNDMQLCAAGCEFLIEACNKLNIDTKQLATLTDGKGWNSDIDRNTRVDIITEAKTALAEKGGSENDIHFADILLQNQTLGAITDDPYGVKIMEQRARFMAENVQWCLAQEKLLGHEKVFFSAHNGHVARYTSAVDTGPLLYEAFGDRYYVIGTGYYKTCCNLPVKEPSGKRTTHTVYSHDPLANAGKKAGLDMFYLDFATIAEDSGLTPYITDYNYMGSLGENFSILNRLLPMSTRVFQPPATLYNAMIYVTVATPTVIEPISE